MVKKSNFSFYITDKFSAWDTTVSIGTDIETWSAVELSDATSILITYEDNLKTLERVAATATGWTLTTSARGLDNTESASADSDLEVDWRPWAICYVTMFANDVVERDADNTLTGDNIYSWESEFSWGKYTQFATTTERDTALWADGVATEPRSGVYCDDTWLHYNYNLSSGQWEEIDTGTATANASTTVAGKLEATDIIEALAGTATWATGAKLAMTPDMYHKIAVSWKAMSFHSTTGSDTYTATMASTLTGYSSRMILVGKFDTANTWACTLNIDAVWAVNIKTREGNDPEDGHISAWSTHILIHDGTNFVLQDPTDSSTTVKGLIETATLAEQVARTSTSLAVTPQGLGAITETKILQVTRAINGATGTVNVAHWMTNTPKYAIVQAAFLGYASNTIYSNWSSTFSEDGCCFQWARGLSSGYANTGGVTSSACIYIQDTNSGSTNHSQGQYATLTADATNLIFDWTYALSGSSSLSNSFSINILLHS